MKYALPMIFVCLYLFLIELSQKPSSFLSVRQHFSGGVKKRKALGFHNFMIQIKTVQRQSCDSGHSVGGKFILKFV